MIRWLEEWACWVRIRLGFHDWTVRGRGLVRSSHGHRGPFRYPVLVGLPLLAPCLFSSAMSAIALLLASFMLPESLPNESRSESAKSPISQLGATFTSIASVLRLPNISALVNVNFLFLVGFTMMHGTFILFTSMEPESGGLGWSERENGWVFAFIGLVGVVVQGGLIRPLVRRFSLRGLMLAGTVLTGIGIASIPYSSADMPMLIFWSFCAAGLRLGTESIPHSKLTTDIRIQARGPRARDYHGGPRGARGPGSNNRATPISSDLVRDCRGVRALVLPYLFQSRGRDILVGGFTAINANSEGTASLNPFIVRCSQIIIDISSIQYTSRLD